MRILYVAQNYYPMNASSITTHEIIKRLAERRHETTLLAPRRCPKECPPGCSFACGDNPRIIIDITKTFVPYHVLNRHRGLGPLILAFSQVLLVLRALKVCKQRRFDVVVSQHHPSHPASISAFILSRIFKLPLVIKTHDVYNSRTNVFQSFWLQLFDNLYQRIFKSANYVLVVSNPLRLEVIRTHGLEESKVLVFRNGVDTQKFRPEVKDAKLLRHTLKAKNEFTLLFIGKIREERGLTALIEALPNIIAKTPHISAVFVGGGPQKSDVQKLAQKLDVEDSLKFLPAVDHDEVPKYICMADVAVGPLLANIDTFGSVPRKVLEYMACAKPVVACRGGVSSDLISDGCNGFLFTKGNIEELASIILKLIHNPALAYEVGLNARKHVETFYDWDKIIGEFEKVLSQAVAECGC